MATKRLFIAIVPPKKNINSLLRSIDEYKKEYRAKEVKWVKPKNLHITLKFIGELEQGKIEELAAHIQAAVKGFGAFQLEISGFKLFPKPSRPSIISAGTADNPDLVKLAEIIDDSLADLGIPKERRKFKGHITLGRCKKSFPGSERLDDKVRKTSFTVNEIIIYRSILRQKGPEYIIEKRVCIA